MKNVTLKQGNQVLNLILQKDIPCEQLQELLASGLLSDLLDANIQQIDRVKFRKVLDLSTFKHDKTKDGWELLEDVPFDGKQFTLKMVEFLKSGEFEVDGEEVRRRAKKLNASRGQRDAEWLLEHQGQIPKELRGKYLIFPGTGWLCGHSPFIPYLRWYDERWCLVFFCLGADLNGYGRLVSSL